MKVTYGIDVKEENDPFIYHAEQTIASFNTAGRPGRYLVDLIPIRTCSIYGIVECIYSADQCFPVKYVPSWFPGAEFQKDALYARDMSRKMVNNPFNVVKEREVRSPL